MYLKSSLSKSGLVCLTVLGLMLTGAMLLLVGCSNNASSSDTSNSSSTTTASAADPGKAIFDNNGCGRCHNLGGAAGGRGRAPDLSHEGADSTHTAQWIADQINNPRSHNPMSRMPAYQGRIQDKDLQTLSSYLAGLK